MSIEVIEFTVEEAGERLDKLLVAKLPEYSRAQIQDFISSGVVKVDGKSAKPGNKLKGGERVVIEIPPEPEEVIEPEDIDLNIVYEDDDIAVVDKPAGMVVHPGVGNETGTLVAALLARYPELVELQDDPRAQKR
ncbi:MAG: RNA pseudouridine synthase, partial [Anaerolineae bacterium]|nr:RNA pseudouridine synthase [Anaerolineae bacterium]